LDVKDFDPPKASKRNADQVPQLGESAPALSALPRPWKERAKKEANLSPSSLRNIYQW
jgi:hypothetical protein